MVARISDDSRGKGDEQPAQMSIALLRDDRGYGKPAQTISDTIVRDELSDAELVTELHRVGRALGIDTSAITPDDRAEPIKVRSVGSDGRAFR